MDLTNRSSPALFTNIFGPSHNLSPNLFPSSIIAKPNLGTNTTLPVMMVGSDKIFGLPFGFTVPITESIFRAYTMFRKRTRTSYNICATPAALLCNLLILLWTLAPRFGLIITSYITIFLTKPMSRHNNLSASQAFHSLVNSPPCLQITSVRTVFKVGLGDFIATSLAAFAYSHHKYYIINSNWSVNSRGAIPWRKPWRREINDQTGSKTTGYQTRGEQPR